LKFNKRNIHIGNNVELGHNVKIGDNCTIYDNVIIGQNTVICNNCIIGEPLSDYYTNENYVNQPTYIGENTLIRSHAIIYAGAKLGNELVTGHRIMIREETVTGDHCMFGNSVDLQGHCILGDYNRLHSYISIGKYSHFEDYVFIYPYVVVTNDPTPPSTSLKGATIGSFSQITTGAVLLPGTIIGKHCLVGANSTVGGEYDDDSFITGNPAKRLGQLSKMPFFNEDGIKHYPWPNNFDYGMPWKKGEFDVWLSQNNERIK
jgi:acetyltransferase-like isoleucine patch superfamily enzyme